MINEEGVDVGRTVGDLMSEVSKALVRMYGVSEPTSLRGDGWEVFRSGVTLHAVVVDDAWRDLQTNVGEEVKNAQDEGDGSNDRGRDVPR